MSGEETYTLGDVANVWFEYDRQNDILYINFGTNVEDADEEFLVGEDIILRIKAKRVVSITIMGFMEKLGLTIC